jgi:hypothetical protein
MATELFIVDGAFNLVGRGIGRLESTLTEGIYKVRARTGRQEQEQIVLLDKDTTVTFDPDPRFASPAPLSGTTKAPDHQIEAAQRLSRTVHVRSGTGSQVFLFARAWTPDEPGARSAAEQHPARGITLHRWDGSMIADLERHGVADEPGAIAGDSCSGCTIELDPGVYVLRRETAAGATIEQSIVASPGWQTQVFLLMRSTGVRVEPAPSTPDAASGIDDLAILMSRGGFVAAQEDMRLAELARLALTDERRVLSRELREMAGGKFENPMLGIFAAHILDLSLRRQVEDAATAKQAAEGRYGSPLLLASDMTPGDLSVIVANLRYLVGDAHPDVEALSLRCPDAGLRTRRPLTFAPMLRRGWSLYVAASNARPGLVPVGLWDRISMMTTLVPFLAWLPHVEQAGRRDAADLVARAVMGQQTGSTSEPSPRAATRTGGGARGFARGALAAAPGEPRLPVEEGARRTPRVARAVKQRASIEHDIPRSALDRAFRRV